MFRRIDMILLVGSAWLSLMVVPYSWLAATRAPDASKTLAAGSTTTSPLPTTTLAQQPTATVLSGAPQGATDGRGIAAVLAWPIVVLVALLLFRASIDRFLQNPGGRVKSLSLGIVSIEFAELARANVNWAPGQSDVRHASFAGTPQSGASSLLEQMGVNANADYAVIDLGRGDKWLTSRLFIFAVMLQRMRNLRYFVFVHATASSHGQFLGISDLSTLRWALARRYPWLEQALAWATMEIGPLQLTSTRGALDPWQAENLLNRYLNDLQANLRIRPDEIKDLPGLLTKLRDENNKIASYLRSQLSPKMQSLLLNSGHMQGPSGDLGEALVFDLNRILQDRGFYDPERFAGCYLPLEPARFLQQKPQDVDVIWLNRLLLHYAYPQEIEASKIPLDPSDSVPVLPSRNWVELRNTDGTLEHARWSTSSQLERLLGNELIHAHLRTVDLQTLPHTTEVRMVLREKGPVVAVVDEHEHFERLVDRQNLVDTVVHDLSQNNDDQH